MGFFDDLCDSDWWRSRLTVIDETLAVLIENLVLLALKIGVIVSMLISMWKLLT